MEISQQWRVCGPLRWWLTLCLSILPFSGFAQDNFFNRLAVDIDSQNSSGSAYSLFGWLTQKISYGLEVPSPPFTRQSSEFNKLETSLFAQFDSRIGNRTGFRISGKAFHDAIYTIDDNTDFSTDERNEFRNRFEVKDLYIEHRFENGAYLKLGNQLFAWGLAEYLRVADLISTEDQYTFGQQDLEDLRLQVPAALFSFNAGDWLIDSVVTYRAGRNDVAPAGDEFDQFIRLRDSGLTLSRSEPANEMEAFLRASTHYSKGDLQFVAGEFNDNALSVNRLEAVKSISPRLNYTQNRMRALAVAANWVDGNWVVFGEAGVHYDKAVRPTAEMFLARAQGWDTKDQLLSVLGMEYNGFRNLVLTFEVDNVHTRGHDKFMQANSDQLSFGSRLYWTTMNERMQLLAVWNELADNAGHVSRVSLDYSWSDEIKLGLLWMNYSNPNDSIFYDYRNNDVLQLHLQFNFQN